MRHKDSNISLTNSLSIKTGLSNIVEGCCFYFSAWGALIVAIIQSFRATMPVWETAHHPLLLLKSQRAAVGYHMGWHLNDPTETL